MDIKISSAGVAEATAIIAALTSGPSQNKVLGPSLRAQAVVVSKFVRLPNKQKGAGDDFADRTPAERAAAGFPGARGLRKSIKATGLAANYGGRKYKAGRAAVRAGGKGARHSFLVHDGHGGPRPARPYRFLRRAMLEKEQEALAAFLKTARARFALVATVSRKSGVGAASRTISRRHRRG